MMTTKQTVAAIAAAVDQLQPEFAAMSDAIWDYAELSFSEHQSAQTQISMLEKHGFRIEREIAHIETAFIGESGEGKPIIAFLGEFDALAGLNQKAGIAIEQQEKPGGTGHGCGHNLLGTGSMLAAVALAQHLKANNLSGTIRYYG
ncbi:MAG: amidohydrolase, partial [Pyrinomonadaceae bacterium]